MKVIANTTVISNFASIGRLDLLQALLGEVFISSGVYDEIQDGLQEGYDFYSNLESLIYPLYQRESQLMELLTKYVNLSWIDPDCG